jgi:multiple sugar transport system substrate-binding protein
MKEEDSDSFISRRRVLRTTGAASVVGLAGCTSNDEDGNENEGGNENNSDDGGNEDDSGGNEDGNDEAQQVKVTGVWSGGEQEDFRAVADHVEDQANVAVQYHPRTTDSLLTGTLMDYESGVAPADVVVMPSPARILSDARNGHLEPIGDTWDAENFAVDPERVTVDGEVYAAPFKMDLKPGFWYRKSFFDEHGLSEPGSYDEFLSLCDEISGIEGVDAPIASGNGTGWPLSDITEGFLMRQENGAQFQQGLIDGDASFTDDRARTAFEEIKELHDKGYFSETRNFGVQYEYFWENTLPLYFMGSFTPAQEAVKDASDLGVFRLPGTDGMTSSVNWFTVPAYTENTEAAKSAVSEFVSADGQQVWAERGGFIASNTEVPDDAYQIEVMANLPDLANEVTVVPDLDDALGNPFQEEFWSQLKGLWSDPSTAIDSIVESLDSAHQESLSEE